MPDTRLLEQRNGITFLECLYASVHGELLPQWERLWKKKLVSATGNDLVVMGEFADFVYKYVFSAMPEVEVVQ